LVNNLCWADLKLELAEAPSQREYNRLIDFENRDLLIRELKQDNLNLLNQILTEHPTLREKAPYNPEECLIDFLNEKEELTPAQDPVKRDEQNIAFLKEILKDSRIHGPKSYYIKTVLDARLPWER
jgi:hypothetical protein